MDAISPYSLDSVARELWLGILSMTKGIILSSSIEHASLRPFSGDDEEAKLAVFESLHRRSNT